VIAAGTQGKPRTPTSLADSSSASVVPSVMGPRRSRGPNLRGAPGERHGEALVVHGGTQWGLTLRGVESSKLGFNYEETAALAFTSVT
jgi:hypothetical protein